MPSARSANQTPLQNELQGGKLLFLKKNTIWKVEIGIIVLNNNNNRSPVKKP